MNSSSCIERPDYRLSGRGNDQPRQPAGRSSVIRCRSLADLSITPGGYFDEQAARYVARVRVRGHRVRPDAEVGAGAESARVEGSEVRHEEARQGEEREESQGEEGREGRHEVRRSLAMKARRLPGFFFGTLPASMRLLLLLLAFCALPAPAQGLKPWTGGATPALELAALDGQPQRLEDYRGRVVLVNFWATWCAPCVEEMPSIEKLRRSLDARRFTVLAVNVGEGPGAA